MMLSYAKTLVGKPFSNAGMARSILFPRQTTGDSFFCAGMYSLRHTSHKRLTLFVLPFAELVAAVLKRGGLMYAATHMPVPCPCTHTPFYFAVCVLLRRSGQSNPGAATPQSLHRLYKNQAAATANPYTLRQFANYGKTSGSSREEGIRLVGLGPVDSTGYQSGYAPAAPTANRSQSRKRSDSPPRASFRCVSENAHFGGYTSDAAVFLKR
jgi:hypothetical protein